MAVFLQQEHAHTWHAVLIAAKPCFACLLEIALSNSQYPSLATYMWLSGFAPFIKAAAACPTRPVSSRISWSGWFRAHFPRLPGVLQGSGGLPLQGLESHRNVRVPRKQPKPPRGKLTFGSKHYGEVILTQDESTHI